MAQAHNFEDLAETGEALVHLIDSSKPENQIRLVNGDYKVLYERHLETQKTVSEILKDLVTAEELVGQVLVDVEEQKTQKKNELDSLGEQVGQLTSKSQINDSEIQFLQRELERLKNAELELQTLQQEVDEDTTEVIPSAIYIAQLYHKVTHIKLEYDTEPHVLKGVHYGTDLATPINIDTSKRSRCDVSDQLWDFVSTKW
ncbi:kinetochore protein Spc24 [Lampris incognitus]|uniref:kinetochore protein Spc24 n=1 Tax=Lampris incognitus TaxID=2546036 RepID=UPI0024B4ECA8|nr:kinetochore protein Spc24 [Lampris incognitus]